MPTLRDQLLAEAQAFLDIPDDTLLDDQAVGSLLQKMRVARLSNSPIYSRLSKRVGLQLGKRVSPIVAKSTFKKSTLTTQPAIKVEDQSLPDHDSEFDERNSGSRGP